MYKTLSIYMSILSYAATAQGTTTDEVSRGQSIYAKCLACHSPERHRTGPKHCGLIGRRAGSLAGFDYSLAMQQSAIMTQIRRKNNVLTSYGEVLC
jgi:cytochrome c